MKEKLRKAFKRSIPVWVALLLQVILSTSIYWLDTGVDLKVGTAFLRMLEPAVVTAGITFFFMYFADNQ